MTKVYVIPNYHKSIVETTSQTITQRKYIKLLETKYDVTVLYPKWGETINEIIGAKNYKCLDIDGKTNRSAIPYEYIKFLSSQDLKNSIIYTFQNDTAIDLKAELSRPPMVFPKIINHFVGGDDYQAKDAKNLKRMMGFSLPTIFNSPYSKLMVEKHMRKVGIIHEMFPWGENDFVSIGIPSENIVILAREQKKHEKFTFIFAGNSFMHFKKIDRLMEIFDKLYSMGLDFKVKFFLLDKDIKNKSIVRPYVEVNKTLRREGFWMEGAKCHAFISTSISETYGIAYWELCQAGCMGLFEERDWVKRIGNVDNNFMFSGLNDGVAKAKLMVENYNDMKKLFDEWWLTTEGLHNERFNDTKYIGVVDKLINNLLV